MSLARAVVTIQPYARQSGRYDGACHMRGGRAEVRAVLYMATVSARRCNPVIMEFYQRLVKAGKKKKAALVACRRKLLTILNAIIKLQKPSLFGSDFSWAYPLLEIEASMSDQLRRTFVRMYEQSTLETFADQSSSMVS